MEKYYFEIKTLDCAYKNDRVVLEFAKLSEAKAASIGMRTVKKSQANPNGGRVAPGALGEGLRVLDGGDGEERIGAGLHRLVGRSGGRAG